MQKRLKSGTENLNRDEKIAALKECVAGIGARIDEIVAEKQAAGENAAKWRKHCWVFASYFWPREGVNYNKLMDIHQKLVRHFSCPLSLNCTERDPGERVGITSCQKGQSHQKDI